MDDDKLRLALIRLAKQYGRYGYRAMKLCSTAWWRGTATRRPAYNRRR
jgi:hypothetical protein